MFRRIFKTYSKWALLCFVAYISGEFLFDTINGSPNLYFEYLRSVVAFTSKSLEIPVRINGQMLNQTFRVRHYLPFSVEHSYATHVNCVGPVQNRSCLFKNLYYADKTFWILTVKGVDLPFADVRIGAFVAFEFSPERRTFFSERELETFVKFRSKPISIPNLTIFFEQLWLHNIGHALFDGLYPAYVALLRFAPKHLQPFRLLYDAPGTNCQHCMSEDVYSRFADLGAMRLFDLANRSMHRWFVFDELLVGSGKLCQRCLQKNLQLPGGHDLNGSQLFRDRMYRRHDLPMPASRQQHSTEQRNPLVRLRAVVIDNKRLTDQDRNEIHAAMIEINHETHENIRRVASNNQSNTTWPMILMHYVDFRTISTSEPKASKSAPANQEFAQHLQLLKTVDIHLAGSGTGQMYQTFLADGAVHINLGGVISTSEEARARNYTSFMEQQVTAGIPYIRALYYPINARPFGIKKDEVVKLALQAARLIFTGFPIPVNPQENLAPDGLLFTEMCQLDAQFCAAVTARPLVLEGSCADTWPEEIVHEIGPWSPNQLNSQFPTKPCPLNRTLLDALRKKYGIEHDV